MLGSHATTAQHTSAHSCISSDANYPMFARFIKNKNGVFSTNYVDILKKYYGVKLGEKLFALQVLAEKRSFFQSGSRWTPLLRGYDHTFGVEYGTINKYFKDTSDEDLTEQLRGSLSLREYISVGKEPHWVPFVFLPMFTGGLFRDGISSALHRALVLLYRGGRWNTKFITESTSLLEDSLGGGLIGYVGNDNTRICRTNEDDQVKDIICTMKYSNADTLQAYFHRPEHVGYHGLDLMKYYSELDADDNIDGSEVADGTA